MKVSFECPNASPSERNERALVDAREASLRDCATRCHERREAPLRAARSAAGGRREAPPRGEGKRRGGRPEEGAPLGDDLLIGFRSCCEVNPLLTGFVSGEARAQAFFSFQI